MKLTNKKGFLARDWLLGFLLFSGVVALGIVTAVGLGNEYGIKVLDSGFNSRYDKLSNITASTSTAFQQLNSPGGMNLIGSFNLMFQAAPGIVALVFSTISFLPNVLMSFGEDFGVPSVITGTLFMVVVGFVTIVLIFIAISFVTRGRL